MGRQIDRYTHTHNQSWSSTGANNPAILQEIRIRQGKCKCDTRAIGKAMCNNDNNDSNNNFKNAYIAV